ncbi:chaplin [Thermoactinospora rubra]|uniref:chaplin n=1 Tax=Thermoactinospora rubra TaxID=1088767 RepID=UPI000A105E4E|nr:chaplin [Thermoactinospora rubra]
MRTWAKASAPAALLAVAVMSIGSGTAVADTSGDSSIGGGNQVNLPVSIPIDISGNAAGVAGESTASSRGGASVENTGNGGIPNKTSGKSSVLGGNQVNAPVNAPINACGNAVSLFGNSDAGCKGGADVKTSGKGGAGGNRTSGDSSILGGNQVTAPITAPINACGNAVAIFGDASAGCKGGASVKNTGVGSGGNTTSGRSSVLGGNQVVAPITAPVNICGNAVAVFGEAFAGCKGGSSVTNNGDKPRRHYHGTRRQGSTGNDTDGRFGAGSGNQVIAPITAPLNVCGNAAGNAPAGCMGGSTVENTASGSGAGGNTTSGRSGVLSGNQVVAPITAPVNVCGNAVAVLGDAAAGCLGGARVGKPVHDGFDHWAHASGRFAKTRQAGGILPALPVVPALSGLKDAGNLTQQMRGSGLPSLPLVGDLPSTLGLPALPAMPGLPGSPATPGQQGQQGHKSGKDKGASPLPAAAPVTDLVASTPVGGAVGQAAGALPVGDVGLMSAATPGGVTGMNSSSLLALVLGAMFAASATLFATTRRLRFRRK